MKMTDRRGGGVMVEMIGRERERERERKLVKVGLFKTACQRGGDGGEKHVHWRLTRLWEIITTLPLHRRRRLTTITHI